MVAQVLAELNDLENELNFEKFIFNKLNGYTIPVKTKLLSNRLNIDSNSLVPVLNKLQQKGLIRWHKPKKLDNKQTHGWIVV